MKWRTQTLTYNLRGVVWSGRVIDSWMWEMILPPLSGPSQNSPGVGTVFLYFRRTKTILHSEIVADGVEGLKAK
jgi:hypothetical protein